jgi:holo-[acyl-carrier protein] synthase
MIYGVGIDMVQVRRMENIMERWGDRFLKRVFTPREIEYCHQKTHIASRFALRFAAKEAFSKALGLGFRNGLRMRDVEIVRAATGPPHIALYRTAKKLFQRHGLKNSFLSLTDDGLYAIAVVVLEG